MIRTTLLLALLSASSLAASEIAHARWIAGCWAGSDGARSFEERWMRPRDGAMVGVARSFKDEKMTSVELVVLRVRDGRLSYEAFPVGQGPGVFPATSVTADSLTFEEPKHDFPQRIVYRRVSHDAIFARIEGSVQGKAMALDFPMKRVACD